MNIRFYSLALTVVAMLSSCSNDEGMAAGGGTSHSPGDVAVSLAAAGLTRASIESGADGLFEADSIGVFALASGFLPGVSADGNEDGKVSFDWADKAAMEDFLLLDTGDRPLEHGDYFMQVADGKPVEMAVGQGIMLPVPPAGAGQHRYRVAVTLRDRQGNVYHGAPQEVGLPGGRAFEAGKSYNVKLVVGMGLDTLSAARQARSGAGIMDIVEARGQ